MAASDYALNPNFVLASDGASTDVTQRRRHAGESRFREPLNSGAPKRSNAPIELAKRAKEITHLLAENCGLFHRCEMPSFWQFTPVHEIGITLGHHSA